MSQCVVPGCDRKHNAHGYCMKHYCQMRRVGKILDRSLKDENEAVIDGDICMIKLYDLSGTVKAVTIIDAEDYERAKAYKWSVSIQGYVFMRKGGKSISLSSFILGVAVSHHAVIDHVNGNTFDNRRCNLRPCSTRDNIHNQGTRSDNTSGHKGVFWDKRLKKWRARIKVNYKGIHLGCFDNKEKAATAYNDAAIKHFGEFARLNAI